MYHGETMPQEADIRAFYTANYESNASTYSRSSDLSQTGFRTVEESISLIPQRRRDGWAFRDVEPISMDDTHVLIQYRFATAKFHGPFPCYANFIFARSGRIVFTLYVAKSTSPIQRICSVPHPDILANLMWVQEYIDTYHGDLHIPATEIEEFFNRSVCVTCQCTDKGTTATRTRDAFAAALLDHGRTKKWRFQNVILVLANASTVVIHYTFAAPGVSTTPPCTAAFEFGTPGFLVHDKYFQGHRNPTDC